ncbi:MAG: UbiA family prenyltransferase [Crocinitomicaceae bacterium]|jgi:4-hydroxybenzoate polyprenyltransferase|nr:UbiA family prenyltransferase [Crocinitomicaceae bacterium]
MGLEEETDVKVLAVDLDLSLTKTDVLIEILWAMLSSSPFRFVAMMFNLRFGKAYFKSCVAKSVFFDASKLPFNAQVINYIKDWKKGGGKVVLVTASNQIIADEVGRHLNLFDNVYGSNELVNLKGQQKARFLCEKFGAGKFAYIGDSKADLSVWEEACSVIAVNPSFGLKLQLENRFDSVKYLLSDESKHREIIRLFRPTQWVKNILIFAPILAAQSRDLSALLNNVFAFLIFCMIASAVYIINDTFDIQNDRNHPVKKQRPLACGSIHLSEGLALSGILLILGLTLSIWVDIQLFWLMSLYLILNVLYSAALKKVRFVDLLFLTLFYLARILAGSITGNIDLTYVFLAFSGFLFVALGSLKRLGELALLSNAKTERVPGRGYRPKDAISILLIAAISSILSIAHLINYVSSVGVSKAYKNPGFLWGIVIILTGWIIRLIVLTNQGKSQDPLMFVIEDKGSVIVAFFCFALMLSATFL